jgi:pimeloyl-ACP methyl ester carboxylesterase
MIAIEVAAPRGVVVFLHGTGGGFTLPCWQVAQAARVAQLSTWCPTTSPDALWSTGAGRAIAERAVAAARAQVPGGVVVGVGLSAGGIGLTALGDDLHVDGAIAISGVAADVAPAQHPTLLLHGTHDAMASIAAARALVRADRAGHTELRAYDANHFLLLQQHDAVTAAVAERLALLLVPTL